MATRSACASQILAGAAGTSSNAHDSPGRDILAVAAAVAAAGALAGLTSQTSEARSDSGDRLYGLDEARAFLVEALEKPRRAFRSGVAPRVRLELDPATATQPGGQPGGQPGHYALIFSLPPCADWLQVLAALTSGLGKAAGQAGGGGPSGLEVHSATGSGARGEAGARVEKPASAIGLLLPGVGTSPGGSGGDVSGGQGSVLLQGGKAGGGLGAGSLSLFRDGGFTRTDLEASVRAYEAALESADQNSLFGGAGGAGTGPAWRLTTPGGGWAVSRGPGGEELGKGGHGVHAPGGGGASDGQPKERSMGREEALGALNKLGLEVYEPSDGDGVDWDSLAGYDSVREEVEGTLVLALRDPGRFESLARRTRARFESNRPRAVLFEGPPGTGKTLTARIVAKRCGLPMVPLHLDKVVSKWYGESTKNMTSVFDACEALGAVLFIDEIDALASSRESGEMHEATRRVLSVLLQRMEGLEGKSRTTLVAATNRRQDLDPALLSRFGLSLRFDLPNLKARDAVFARYAKQLSADDRAAFAEAAEGLSCRDMKEIAEQTERRWVAKLIRKEVTAETPPLGEYLDCLKSRLYGANSHGGEISKQFQL